MPAKEAKEGVWRKPRGRPRTERKASHCCVGICTLRGYVDLPLYLLFVLKQTALWEQTDEKENVCVYGAPSMQQDIVQMNNGCTVHLSLPPGSFRQIVTLAGEEAARVVSTERHLVALPLPSRVKVLFITCRRNSAFVLVASFQSIWAFIPILIQPYAVFLPWRVFVRYHSTARWRSFALHLHQSKPAALWIFVMAEAPKREEGKTRERDWTGAILRQEGGQATKLYSLISGQPVAFQWHGCQSPRYKSVIHKNSLKRWKNYTMLL